MKKSVYLQQKVKTFDDLISFFLDGNSSLPHESRKTKFLSQLDFWEWEAEELIFSFTTFEERSKIWTNKHLAYQNITKLGITLKGGVYLTTEFENNIEAPWDELKLTIDKYNMLINRCGKMVVGGLDNFKKQIPNQKE